HLFHRRPTKYGSKIKSSFLPSIFLINLKFLDGPMGQVLKLAHRASVTLVGELTLAQSLNVVSFPRSKTGFAYFLPHLSRLAPTKRVHEFLPLFSEDRLIVHNIISIPTLSSSRAWSDIAVSNQLFHENRDLPASLNR